MMMNRMYFSFLGIVMVMMLACPLYAAKTMVIQDGLTVAGSSYTGTESTWLSSANPGTNYGANGIMRVGYQGGGSTVFRTLLRFTELSYRDAVDIGLSAEGIISAKIILTTDAGFEGSGTCELRVADANEVDVNDIGWQQDYATWNNKFDDGNSIVSWQGGAGLGSNYGTVIDSVTWSAGAPTGTQMEFNLTGDALELLRDWVRGDDQWYNSNIKGSFVLRSTAESGAGNNYIDFYSEENTDSNSFKPILEITYVPTETFQVQEGMTIAGEVYGATNGGSSSAWFNSGNPNWKGGTNQICRVGYQYDEQFSWLSAYRSVLQFAALSHWVGVEPYADLGFPAGAIVGAKLVMTTDTSYDETLPFGGSGTCELRIVDSTDEDWVETYCNWNKKRAGMSGYPDLTWVGGPGLGTNFGGIVDSLDWDDNTPNSTPAWFDASTPEALGIVRGWITGDNTDGSFILKATDEVYVSDPCHNYLDFFSEDVFPSLQPSTVKPMLEISYIPTAMLEIQDGLEIAGSTYSGTESAWIDSGAPNINYGLNQIMRLGFQYPDGGFQSTYRSLIRFGLLSHWAGVDIGIDVNAIVAARLVLTLDDSYEGDTYVRLRAFDVNDEDWTQMYCTWNKKRFGFPGNPDLDWVGGTGGENSMGGIIDIERCKVAYANTQRVFDLDSQSLNVVKGWITGDNTSTSFMLMSDDELGDPNSNDYIDFYSEQTSQGDTLKPKLQIFYYTDAVNICEDAKQAGLMLKADIDENCIVDIKDLELMVQRWLDCIDPQDPDCQI